MPFADVRNCRFTVGEKCKPLKSVRQWMFYEKALKAVNTGGDLLL